MMLSDIECPLGLSFEKCPGPITFELAGIRPESSLCREQARQRLEANPNYFAGLLPIDLSVMEEEVVIDLRVKRAVVDAVNEIKHPTVTGSSGLRLVHSK